MAGSDFDVIVVGSGMSGGWAAKEFTEAGLKTLVLEAGRPINPIQDYVEHVPVWDERFRGMRDRKKLMARQPIQRLCYACDELASKFFVDDVEEPYTTEPDKPFAWIRGRHVGGRSIMWGRQVYRWSDLDFAANARDGIGADWPIRYRDIAPWYDYVERFAGVSGQKEGLPQLPDGQFQPPMDLTCVEQHAREAIARRWPGQRVLTIGRVAILTRDQDVRQACHYCGPCHRGCVSFSYFSSVNATLPAARSTGRLTLRPHSIVHSLIFDSRKRRVTGVRVIDGETREGLEFQAPILFLCASALESTRILFNSATPEFSDGLGNSSGELGRNLMDHTMGAGAIGRMPGFEDVTTGGGRRPNGVYIARFRNVKKHDSPFLRGYGFQGGSWQDDWTGAIWRPGFGAEFKRSLRRAGPWGLTLRGYGEMLPSPKNYVALDKSKVDKWGIPVLKIHCEWSENDHVMLKDMTITAAEMLEAAGARNVRTFIEPNPPGLTIHEMGTARMGKDPRTSVLNAHNQMHDIPNVFITDGACMTSNSCVNPSITYMALTARACHYALEQRKLGRL